MPRSVWLLPKGFASFQQRYARQQNFLPAHRLTHVLRFLLGEPLASAQRKPKFLRRDGKVPFHGAVEIYGLLQTVAFRIKHVRAHLQAATYPIWLKLRRKLMLAHERTELAHVKFEGRR